MKYVTFPKRSFTRNLAGLALSLSAISMSGCVSLLPKPAPSNTVYRLLTPGEAVASSPSAAVVRIDRPGGLNVYETKDILVSPDGREVSMVAQAQWAEI